jgi:hypothetical protein
MFKHMPKLHDVWLAFGWLALREPLSGDGFYLKNTGPEFYDLNTAYCKSYRIFIRQSTSL